MARSSGKTAVRGDERRQKLWRELALVAIAPLLLYLLASLFSYSTDDPGWSRTGSVAGAIHNIGGLVGAYLADLGFWFFGYVAYTVPVVLGGHRLDRPVRAWTPTAMATSISDPRCA